MTTNYLQNAIGFTQEDVLNIKNGSAELYVVHVVYENRLEKYFMHTTKEDALKRYLELCKIWYSEDGVADFREKANNEDLSEVDFYDQYFGSEDYYDVGDHVNVTWEILFQQEIKANKEYLCS